MFLSVDCNCHRYDDDDDDDDEDDDDDDDDGDDSDILMATHSAAGLLLVLLLLSLLFDRKPIDGKYCSQRVAHCQVLLNRTHAWPPRQSCCSSRWLGVERHVYWGSFVLAGFNVSAGRGLRSLSL